MEIPIQNSKQTDIFAFGFGKDLNRGLFNSSDDYFATNVDGSVGGTYAGSTLKDCQVEGALYFNRVGDEAYSKIFYDPVNDNFAAGRGVLQSNVSGESNVAIGDSVLLSNTDGDTNIGIGPLALVDNVNGNLNIAIGENALQSNVSGQTNIAIGYNVFNKNISGSDNVVIGGEALSGVGSSDLNVVVGTAALQINTTGSNNVAIGSSSGISNITGSQNVLLGDDADVGSGALTNAVAIGANTTVSNSNTIVLGNGCDVIISGTLTVGGLSTNSLSRKIDINPFFPKSTTGGAWVNVNDPNSIGGGWKQSSGAQNDAIDFDYFLEAGTYSFFIMHNKDTNRGIYTFKIDGASIGTVDGYAAAPATNQTASITSVAVANAGLKNINLTMATKNAASTNYYATFQLVTIIRTA